MAGLSKEDCFWYERRLFEPLPDEATYLAMARCLQVELTLVERIPAALSEDIGARR